MEVEPFPSGLRRQSLAALAALCLSGCGRSYYLRDLRAEYQAPEIPSLFGRNGAAGVHKSGFRLTGYAAYNRQREFRYSIDTNYSVGGPMDEEPRPVQGEASIMRLPSLAGGSASYLGEHFLAGLAMGVPLDQPELGNGGLFFGLTPHFGAWTPMVTVGIFLSRVHTRLDYLNFIDDPYSDTEVKRDTVDELFWDPSVPIKGGLQYRAGPAAIYFVAGRSGTGFWPLRGEFRDTFVAKTWDASLGLQVSLPYGIECTVESGREWTEIPDRLTERHWKGRGFLSLDFP
jgi:hypothetical protein